MRDRGGGVHAGAARRPGVRPGQCPGRRAGNGHLSCRHRRCRGRRYHERAVRALAASSRAATSAAGDGGYLVGERLRRLVRFRRHNLARGVFPPPGEAAFDLVVCRNVLIYFEPPLAAQVIESLQRSLRPGGLLVLGAADALMRITPRPLVPAAPVAGAAQPGRPGDRPAARAACSPASRRSRASSGWRPRWMPRTRATGAMPSRRWRRCSPTTRWTPTRISSGGWRGGEGGGGGGGGGAGGGVSGGAIWGVTLEAGEPEQAVAALRRALYADPTFSLAAFTLGRAHDALGDGPAGAARRMSGCCGRSTRRTTGTS